MELFIGIVIGLFVLVVLVVLHELGHAIVAHRNGVVVEEFGVGFPPKAWSKKLKNGVVFSVNWLPIGGFVKLKGESDSASKKGDYGAATFWQKTKILFAGVVVNWLVAVVLLTILALVGLPKIVDNQFSIASDTTIINAPVQLGSVSADYPAAKAGLKSGDTIVSFAGESIDTTDQFITVSKANRGQSVSVVYKRDGTEYTTKVALRDADKAVFGSTLGQSQKIRATWSAPIVGVVTTAQFTWVTIQGLGHLVSDFFGGLAAQLSSDKTTREQGSASLDEASKSVAGPVGILGTIFPQAGKGGVADVVFLSAIISLTLAVMNVLPIPALDGGSWFLMAIFRVLKKPLTKDLEEKIKGTGFLILMALVVLVTVGDVAKLFA
ncbi:MAG: M50 family metallopeptidase [Candidatus Saccharimonadales bacterium]